MNISFENFIIDLERLCEQYNCFIRPVYSSYDDGLTISVRIEGYEEEYLFFGDTKNDYTYNMTKAEQELMLLKEQLNNVEDLHDFSGWNISKKIKKQKRLIKFEKYISILKKYGYIIAENELQSKFLIVTETFGTIEYYPKSDKLFIQNKKIWLNYGFKWIKSKLVEQQAQ